MIFKFKSIRSISIQKIAKRIYHLNHYSNDSRVFIVQKSSDAIQNKINTYSVQLIEEISGNIKKMLKNRI